MKFNIKSKIELKHIFCFITDFVRFDNEVP